jgi:hypothetical protein
VLVLERALDRAGGRRDEVGGLVDARIGRNRSSASSARSATNT